LLSQGPSLVTPQLEELNGGEKQGVSSTGCLTESAAKEVSDRRLYLTELTIVGVLEKRLLVVGPADSSCWRLVGGAITSAGFTAIGTNIRSTQKEPSVPISWIATRGRSSGRHALYGHGSLFARRQGSIAN
jgi:hypothetical protein